MKKNILLMVLLLHAVITSAQQVTATSIVPITSTTVGEFEKFEAGITLSTDNFGNHFEPDEIDVYAIFTSVSTGDHYLINAFWFTDFKQNDNTPDPTWIPPDQNHVCGRVNGEGVSDPAFLTPKSNDWPWRIRFAPDITGEWTYQVFVRHGGQTTSSAVYSFNCVSSENPGYIGVGTNKTHFTYKYTGNRDAKSFVPLGVNTWWGAVTSDVFNRAYYRFVKSLIERSASAGGNTVRVFMSEEQAGLEWNEDGVGKYYSRQNRAFVLDRIFEIAEANNVKIQLVLISNHEFDTLHWHNNPYRTLPASYDDNSQLQFFSDPQSIHYFKNRLRYVIARWGYSTSILSYEMWNESIIIQNANPSVWNNPQVVENWFNDVVTYARTLDNNHMYTNSGGGPDFFNFGTGPLDYVQDHYYTNDKHMLFNLSVLAQYSIKTYKKPYLCGEFGPKDACFPLNSAYTDPYFLANFGEGNYVHDRLDFHNSLWSGLFNGSAAPPFYWHITELFDSCRGGPYKNFKAVSKFLLNDDFFTKELAFSTNKPTSGRGPKDFHDGYEYENNSNPVWTFYKDPNVNPIPPDPLSEYRPYGITTSDDKAIDVFAARTTDDEGKIYGWVHNNENYWYKTPHKTLEPNVCPTNEDNLPTQVSYVPTLTRETMTFDNIECDGMYKVEYYSTYPLFDIDGDNVLDNGGLIVPFSQSIDQAYCGSLTVDIPTLAPIDATMSNAPYAPDYAFKISKIQDYWSHSYVISQVGQLNRLSNNNSSRIFYSDNNGAIRTVIYNSTSNTFYHAQVSPTFPSTNNRSLSSICANGDQQVFYRGADSKLQCYYWDGSAWVHIWMTDWNSNSQDVYGNIAIANGNVYFEGMDHRIHRFQYVGVPAWQHSILPNPGNDPNILMNGGSIAVADDGTHVFYKGSDGRLQCYYIDNGNVWVHVWMTDWSNSSQNVAGDIKWVPDGVYYVGPQGTLHRYHYNSGTSLWEHLDVLDKNTLLAIQVPTNTDLSLAGNADQIFFKGPDNQMHHLWGKTDNKYNEDMVICFYDLNSSYEPNGRIASQSDGSTMYIGQNDGYIHMYAFDNGCNPRENKTGKRPANTIPLKANVFEKASSHATFDPTDIGNQDKTAFNDPSTFVKIFPNPFASTISVTSGNNMPVTIKIVDTYGRIVYKNDVAANDHKINTETFPAGVYLISVLNQGNVVRSEKLVKNK